MAKAYYSTVFDHTADQVWAVIRRFDDYAWAGVKGETIIEDGKSGDQVGAVRRVRTGEGQIRQRLLACSDVDRCYTYEFCDQPPFPVRNYMAMIGVRPIVESGQAFVEWWATFDCADDDLDRWTTYFRQEGFAKWLASLRGVMASRSLLAPCQ